MDQSISIGTHKIGPGAPCYIVAEMSANHNQCIERAEKIVRAAAESGANAIKLQTYTADTLTISCDSEVFLIHDGPWKGYTLHKLYQEAYTPWEWHTHLKRLANQLGMDCFSTPFDTTALDFLEELNIPCYKVSSFELVDTPLLKKIASKGKPVILSTGMATRDEIEEAVITLRGNGAGGIVLLKCTSAYPASPDDANLRTIPDMMQSFNCPIGLSDHTMGSVVALTSIALGACMIEKHFTLSRQEEGPDSAFSMEPREFKQMVQDIRTSERSLGRVCYEITEKQKGSIIFRRSLFVTEDITVGDIFSEKNIRSIRPGYGITPKHLDKILGRKSLKNIRRGTPLNWDMVQDDAP